MCMPSMCGLVAALSPRQAVPNFLVKGDVAVVAATLEDATSSCEMYPVAAEGSGVAGATLVGSALGKRRVASSAHSASTPTSTATT
eukprot:CAMPEP_0172727342 /NCGR_PEP_ID=MMETSP1074-20121228/91624_1 /TAXON_ID=2916 /ORGANISM="Ceratium fusus, Strain PA161109" /LENGTH=85 /DNA_ID=CAMNT_0013554479 /DNA_START=284 /DNA_END=542 /DNA_ORIENTATION=+